MLDNFEVDFSFVENPVKLEEIKSRLTVLLAESGDTAGLAFVQGFQKIMVDARLSSETFSIDVDVENAAKRMGNVWKDEISGVEKQLAELIYQMGVFDKTELRPAFLNDLLDNAKSLEGFSQRLLQKAMDQNATLEDRVRILNILKSIGAELTLPSLDKLGEDLQQIQEKYKGFKDEKIDLRLNPDRKQELLKDLATIEEAIKKLNDRKDLLSAEDQTILVQLEIDASKLQKQINDASKRGGQEWTKEVAKGIQLASQTAVNLIDKVGDKDLFGSLMAGGNALGGLAGMFDKTGIASSIIGGITGIFGAIDGFMNKKIQEEMNRIKESDSRWLKDYEDTKNDEIEARKKHIDELNDQFNRSKSVYNKMFEMGAISSSQYNQQVGGLTSQTSGAVRKEEEAIELARRQQEMVASYIERRQELQQEAKEIEKWGVNPWEEARYSKVTRGVGKLNGAITSIQGAKSLEDIKPYPKYGYNYAYHGFQGYTTEPTVFVTSEKGQREHVSITPSYKLGQGLGADGMPARLQSNTDLVSLSSNSSGGNVLFGGDIVINGTGLDANQLTDKFVDTLWSKLQQRVKKGYIGGRNG
jgi:hypothetical protein